MLLVVAPVSAQEALTSTMPGDIYYGYPPPDYSQLDPTLLFIIFLAALTVLSGVFMGFAAFLYNSIPVKARPLFDSGVDFTINQGRKLAKSTKETEIDDELIEWVQSNWDKIKGMKESEEAK